ncbi:Primosomal protein N' (replication factor Y) -superfamily II helicase [hydrothermal vent metagenome]|uniref:Primosomal protein N' (Replication factor Y) -superfamily II helicase n=1 Tax=hydrothermal vent metagenome TaxID=652676 RepID=A0A3B1DMD4_9ZZZZ
MPDNPPSINNDSDFEDSVALELVFPQEGEKASSLKTVSITDAPGQATDENKGRIFPCEGCGADLEFHIGQQLLKCPYCGYEKELQTDTQKEIVENDYKAMLRKLEEWSEQKQSEKQTEEENDQQEIVCDACGGHTLFSGTLTSSECPYCASPMQLDRAFVSKQRVPYDGVLPFKIDRKKAHASLKEWVKSRWFAPNAFLKKGVEGKFSGIYLPYWTFDSMTGTWYEGERGEYYYVTVGIGKNQRQERRTRWYPASGGFQRFFDDILVSASKKMNRKLLENLDPWPLVDSLPFNQQVIAGFLARTYDQELDEGFEDAKTRIDNAILQEVHARIGGDTQRVTRVQSQYDAITYKYLLLPIWLLAYRYNEKLFQVVINAATGKVQGERPYSWVKIGVAVLSAAAAAATVGIVSSGG